MPSVSSSLTNQAHRRRLQIPPCVTAFVPWPQRSSPICHHTRYPSLRLPLAISYLTSHLRSGRSRALRHRLPLLDTSLSWRELLLRLQLLLRGSGVHGLIALSSPEVSILYSHLSLHVFALETFSKIAGLEGLVSFVTQFVLSLPFLTSDVALTYIHFIVGASASFSHSTSSDKHVTEAW